LELAEGSVKIPRVHRHDKQPKTQEIMQQQLHKNNIPCHPDSYRDERNEGPHSLIRKLPHWLIFSFLFISLSGYAQQYDWQWAMNGGGNLGGIGDEQIYDVKVGTDNNYYFIATIKGNSGAQLNGVPQTVYNVPNGGDDIFLFSTTCDGTVRWSQAIGGEHSDRAYNLVLDSNNNVYVGAYITSDGNYN